MSEGGRKERAPHQKLNPIGAGHRCPLSCYYYFVITSTSTTTSIPATSTVASLLVWDSKAFLSLQRRPSSSSPSSTIYGLSPHYLIPSPKTYIHIPRLLKRRSVSPPWISSNPPSHLRSPKAVHFLIRSETESMSPIQSGPSIMLQNGYPLPLPPFAVTTGWKQMLIDAIYLI